MMDRSDKAGSDSEFIRIYPDIYMYGFCIRLLNRFHTALLRINELLKLVLYPDLSEI